MFRRVAVSKWLESHIPPTSHSGNVFYVAIVRDAFWKTHQRVAMDSVPYLFARHDCFKGTCGAPVCTLPPGISGLVVKNYTSINSRFDISSHACGLFRSAEPISAGVSGKVRVIGSHSGQEKECTTSRAVFHASVHAKSNADRVLGPKWSPLGIYFVTDGIAKGRKSGVSSGPKKMPATR